MKTKIILIIIIGLILGGEGYVLSRINKKQMDLGKQIEQLNKQQIIQQKEHEEALIAINNENENKQKNSIKNNINIEGRVVGLSPDSWIIDQESGAIEVGININTPIYKNENDEKVPVSIVDVKAGDTVRAKISEDGKQLLEAILLN